MVGRSGRKDWVSEEQETSDFVPDHGGGRHVSVDEPMAMEELESHRYVA